ncbi:hypothetical protein [Lichenifustis flavocetrariae]|uniref:Uncharacterized protein n=1 Tax=Lichenifustis flavocetrariae TaxID=2949735 RepID=A0AA42CIX4_9HYPH|nr:hypothetical protein [Lichenifustis flavocetrariae]MCW6507351.1 hypothetical protein [Lichenifustis flavocetrariae]
MTFLVENDHDAYARILVDGLQDVLQELHAIDLLDLVSFIRFSQYTAIEDLLQSSTELFFKEGTLTFAWNASVEMDWGDVPTVTLAMEFSHLTVSVFFDLSLRAMDQVVRVEGILFDPDCRDPLEKLKRLSRAVSDAHLPRQRVRPSLGLYLPKGPGNSDPRA